MRLLLLQKRLQRSTHTCLACLLLNSLGPSARSLAALLAWQSACLVSRRLTTALCVCLCAGVEWRAASGRGAMEFLMGRTEVAANVFVLG